MGEFDNPLIVSTPQLRGQKVKDAQWLLSGHNRFAKNVNPLQRIDTYEGRLDGIYGSATCAATKHAKFLLGYKTVDEVFGEQLYHFLKDTRLPPDYAERRKARLADLAKPIKSKAVDIALTQIGYKEHPMYSNETKYGSAFGFNGVPWCAEFVWWCLMNQAGRKPAFKTASVEQIYRWAEWGQYGLKFTNHPSRGDLAIYDFGGQHAPFDHVGLFMNWVDGTHFRDIAGNTGPVSQSNGGEVLSQEYQLYRVNRFVQVV